METSNQKTARKTQVQMGG